MQNWGGGGEWVFADTDVFEGGGGNKPSGVKRDHAASCVLKVFSKRIKSRC